MAFVDSSFWIALRYRPDGRHATAGRLFQEFADTDLVTSNLVRGETWTWLNRRAGHRYAVKFLDVLQRTKRLRVAEATPDIEAEAWRWLRRHDERPYSFVDATSFALMRRMKIRDALAFDGDFAAAGFRELRP